MMAAQIMITLPETLTDMYENGSDDDKRRIQHIIELILCSKFNTPPITLTEAMDRMGQEAAARGLTPEILEKILNSYDDE
ncbi:MAG: hypothetical protein SGI73_21540 [Chloroflexota bacterium]|nr:hypothetical protein [Chloroflexota bacterium]